MKLAIHSDPPNVSYLKERVWMENGLLSTSIRREAWLLLLGEDPNEILTCPNYKEPIRDENQIKVDVDRSFVYYILLSSVVDTLNNQSQSSPMFYNHIDAT